MKHQIQIPDRVWEWAQNKSGADRPATYLRELLYEAMIADANKAAADVTQIDIKARWRALGLASDPTDLGYTYARQAWIDMFDDEIDALEAAERKQKDGRDGEDGVVSNMRAWMVWWYRNEYPTITRRVQ